MQDRFFNTPLKEVSPFQFNHEVADVFDDMLNRSIPFYPETQKLLCDLANYHLLENDRVYDLGCSTGTSLILLDSFFKEKNIEFIGVDNSAAMIEKAKEKSSSHIQYKIQNIEDIDFKPCKIIILNYTLQFIAPEKRLHILQKISSSLIPGGFLFLGEKILSAFEKNQRLTTDIYYDFKRRNQYSELEISQKRQALENVLIPLKEREYYELLNQAQFSRVETLFKWTQFAHFIAFKD